MSIQIEKKIGEGSYADVWSAIDQFGRKVAVKTLRPADSHSSDAMTHAKALAKAQHPSIITIFTLEKVSVPGSEEMLDGIVMELFEGQTLEDRLKESRLTPEDVFRLSNSLIDGLEHIHKSGLTHNDLHQANILVSGQQLKIIDILYRKPLSQISSHSKEDRIKRDLQDLSTAVYDMAAHSTLSEESVKQFGMALRYSGMSFADVRKAVRSLHVPAEIVEFSERRAIDPKSIREHPLRQLGQEFRKRRSHLSDSERLPLELPFNSSSRIYCHIYPFVDQASPDKTTLRSNTINKYLFKPVPFYDGSYSWSYENTRDGIFSHSRDRPFGYCFLLNDGSCEAVDMATVRKRDNTAHLLSQYLADFFANCIRYYSGCYRELGFKNELWFGFSITGISGFQLAVSSQLALLDSPSERPYRDDCLTLPDIIIPAVDSEQFDAYKLIRPGQDELWQTFGYERCFLYNDNGEFQKSP